jgi:acyl-CoA dehydrogenase
MASSPVRATGGYARVRTQFKTPIGRFEGVEEALTRMGGNLYMMDAARTLTATRSTSGENPRCFRDHQASSHRPRPPGRHRRDGRGRRQGHHDGSVELSRRRLHAASRCDHREGANILTRSLIVFGQGAIRCHPFVLKEIESTRETDPRRHPSHSMRRSSDTSASRCRTWRARSSPAHGFAFRHVP